MEHPHTPTCADCKKWVHKDGMLQKRLGKPIPRSPLIPLPCHKCPKSSDGQPNPAADLKGRGAGAYELWLLIRAGYPLPDEGIVRRNGVLIQMGVDQIERSKNDTGDLLRLLLAGGGKRG